MDKIVIEEVDVCVDCWISILVDADQLSRYSIVASSEDGIITLFDNMPIKGEQ